jgi:hypothetical protein
MRRILLVIILFSLLIPIQLVEGNPIPISPKENPYESDWGVCPLPMQVEDYVYLKEEDIVFHIHNDGGALVLAKYTFENPSNVSRDLNISFPFKGNPSNVKVEINGEEIRTRKKDMHYEFFMTDHTDEPVPDSKILGHYFQMSIGPFEEKVVNLSYISDTKRIEISEGMSYHFHYIIGTGLSWNRPIENARFEFRINKTIYSSHYQYVYMLDYRVSDEPTIKVLEVEYNDWVPKNNYIGVQWYKSDGKDDTTIYDSWLWVFIPVGLFVLIGFGVPIVLILRNKKRSTK